MDIIGCLKKCDSWSEVEDGGAEITNGRYGVLVFFDNREEADDFREALKIEAERVV